MAGRNLRSGSQQKSNPLTLADSLAKDSPTPTATSGKVDSEFEGFVRKGIEEIKSMFKDFQASLDFQANRTSNLEKRVNPLEKKVKILEQKVKKNTKIKYRKPRKQKTNWKDSPGEIISESWV